MIPEEIIAIQHIILYYIHKHRWTDYEDFSRLLTEFILKSKPDTIESLRGTINKFNHPFFHFNKLSKSTFIDYFPYQRIVHRLHNLPKKENTSISIAVVGERKKAREAIFFEDIFPEILQISIERAIQLLPKLENIPERQIQDAFRDALREKGAGNIIERDSDTSLEVADIEHFSLKIHGEIKTFVVVVKSYTSTGGGKKIGNKEISHQIMNAYQGTQPDYVILVVAKMLIDSVVSRLTCYGKTVNKEHLIIICDRIKLVQFLCTRGIIQMQ